MSYPYQDQYVPRGWKVHPEVNGGEIWITNSSIDDFYLNFYLIRYKTKRMGRIAYSNKGSVVPHLFPVFVQLIEYEVVQARTQLNNIIMEKNIITEKNARWMVLEI